MVRKINTMAKLIKAWLLRRRLRHSKRASILRIAELQTKHMRLSLAGQGRNVE